MSNGRTGLDLIYLVVQSSHHFDRTVDDQSKAGCAAYVLLLLARVMHVCMDGWMYVSVRCSSINKFAPQRSSMSERWMK